MSGIIIATERCRICGCTDGMPCIIEAGKGLPNVPCSWLDYDHTLCNNPRCVAVIPLADLERMAILRAAEDTGFLYYER